jgi:hypothetical protein
LIQILLDNARGQKVRYDKETGEFFIKTGTRDKDIIKLKPEKVFASDGNLNYDKDKAIRKNFEKRHKVDKVITKAGKVAQEHPAAVAGGILAVKKLAEKAKNANDQSTEQQDPDLLQNLQEFRATQKSVEKIGTAISQNHDKRIEKYTEKVETQEKVEIFERKKNSKNKPANPTEASTIKRKQQEKGTIADRRDIEKNRSKEKSFNKNDIKKQRLKTRFQAR